MITPESLEQVTEKRIFRNITKSAGVVAFFTMCSRVAGLARDIVTFHFFGATALTDAFFVAFTIPNIMRRFVAEGALTIAFIPIYSEVRKKEGEQKALEFYAAVIGLLLITLTVLVIVGVIFAGYLVYALASGFASDPSQMEIATLLTRYMFPYIFFISLVALSMGVLNSHNHFAVPAASPILLNLSMIGCTFLLYSQFAEPIFALAVGVILGGVLQLLIQVPALYRYGLWIAPSFHFNIKPVRKLLRVMFPALFGIGVYQLNLVILRQLGSYLPAGQISYYYNADRLMQLALGVFSIAIATAALPAMSEQTASGDKAGLLRTWQFSTKLTNFITIPAAFGLGLIGIPIVATLYLHGQYHWTDVQFTAFATMAFLPGLISVAIFRTTVQVFYALEDLRTPVIVAAVTVVVNFALGVALLKYEVVGLSLSLTISSWFQTLLLLLLMRIRLGKLKAKNLLKSMAKQTIMAIFSTGAAYFICSTAVWSNGPTLINIVTLFVSILVAIVLYISGALLFKCDEVFLVRDMVQARLRRKIK
ncbi:MAG: murein biosynthesis integral membrane protein MurJ [bacterium]|nr:murein biosynthesis integral membrane protein MurJ [bacterium]